MTIANVDMAKAWDGEEGERWTSQADRYEATGRHHAGRLTGSGLIAAGDAVLDVGCGTGRSTREAARTAAPGPVLGVDLSSQMLEEARRRAVAEGLTNVSFEQADVQVHPFAEGSFDVAVSSFGAMFFADPVAAFANVRRALRPGGRVALLAWRELGRNQWITAMRDALALGRTLPEPPANAPGPFGLAGEDHVRAVLGSAGFDAVQLESVDEPVWLGDDAEDAWSFVRNMGIVKGLTSDLQPADRERAFDSLQAALAAAETPEGVEFASSAWLITATRPPS